MIPRRGLDVLQEVMNQGHPYSQFSVGSLDSLADRPGSSVRDELMKFYDKHYSANAMRLVVMGAESLDELEALVVPCSARCPISRLSMSDRGAVLRAGQPADVGAGAAAGHSAPVAGVVSHRGLSRTIHVKPVAYLGNLVGHEGQGSLLSQLKAEGLAESLAAGSGLGWRGGALFSVSISLTEKGAANYDRVLQLLFAYTDMLREEGPREWLYTEQSQLAELGFRYREQVSPISYVSGLASGMHYYAPQDTLRGPYLMDRYEEDTLVALLDRIRPENALVILDDKTVATDRVSERYQVPYARSR